MLRSLVANTLGTITLAASLYACNCHDEACLPGSLYFELHGFDSSGLTGTVLRQFDTAGGFAKLLTTTHCDEIYHDTVAGTVHTLSNCGVRGGYNWEIVFPAISKTVRIYDLRYDNSTQRVCNGIGDKLASCYSPVKSYTQDSIVHTAAPPQADHSDAIQILR